MFRNARFVIGLCLLGGISLTAIIAWVTGLLDKVVGGVMNLWDGFQGWVDSPLGWDHLAAGGAVLLPVIIVLFVIFALSDG